MKYLAITFVLIVALVASCGGCASTRAKVSITRENGEPKISIEVFENPPQVWENVYGMRVSNQLRQ